MSTSKDPMAQIAQYEDSWLKAEAELKDLRIACAEAVAERDAATKLACEVSADRARYIAENRKLWDRLEQITKIAGGV